MVPLYETSSPPPIVRGRPPPRGVRAYDARRARRASQAPRPNARSSTTRESTRSSLTLPRALAQPSEAVAQRYASSSSSRNFAATAGLTIAKTIPDPCPQCRPIVRRSAAPWVKRTLDIGANARGFGVLDDATTIPRRGHQNSTRCVGDTGASSSVPLYGTLRKGSRTPSAWKRSPLGKAGAGMAPKGGPTTPSRS